MGGVVFFAFVLFVMGGVTAYVGDRLGSYIGKKRHSTFGLRPRHTALLWTVVSGGVIAVGTLLLFLTLNREFETALVRGPQLLATNSLLGSQNKALTKRRDAAEKQALADGALAKMAQAKADQALKTLAIVSRDLSGARQALTQSQVTLSQRQAALASAQRGLGSTRADLKEAEGRVREARAGVAQARQQYQVASGEVVQANKSVLALVIKQDTLHADNGRLIKQNQVQKNLLLASQGRSLIFRRDQELGRTIVAAQQDPAALRRELSVFLDGVELNARQQGAGGLDDAPPIVIPAFGESVDNEPLAREAALDALTDNITAQGSFMPSIVVVAEARYNTFKGESVKLDLRPYANVMVFPKGAVIAHEAMDGGQPEDAVLRQLQLFLTDQVRTAALQRGIIPQQDPLSGQPLVGRPIDSASSLDLVKQIQKAGPDASVTATAAEDTYSADLLHLDLKVSPASVETH
jgi:hypothetical protein